MRARPRRHAIALMLAAAVASLEACEGKGRDAPPATAAASASPATPASAPVEGEAEAKREKTPRADSQQVEPEEDPCRTALTAMAKKRCPAHLQRELDVCAGLDDNPVCDEIRKSTAPCREIFEGLRTAHPQTPDADIFAFAVRKCGETPTPEALAAGPAPQWTPDRLCDLAFADFLRDELQAAVEVRLPTDRLLAALERSRLECPKKYAVGGEILGPEEMARRRECWLQPDKAGRHFSEKCLDPLQLPPGSPEGKQVLAVQLMTETICSDDPTPCREHGICGARVLPDDHPIPKRRGLVECAAVSDQDCARSKGCEQHGACALDADSGRCAPATKEHCKASLGCKEDEACRLVDHGKAATTLGRPRRSCSAKK